MIRVHSPRVVAFGLLTLLIVGVGCTKATPSTRESAADGGAAYWSVGGRLTPKPAALTQVDYAKKEINFSIVVVGGADEDFLKYVHDKTSDAGPADVTVFSGPGEPSLLYLSLQLGTIRGFQTHVHLYGFGADERISPMLIEVASQADGVIVAQRGGADAANIRAALRAVSPSKRAAPVTVATLGDDALGVQWANVGGGPVFTSSTENDAFFPALKAVTKALLTALNRPTE